MVKTNPLIQESIDYITQNINAQTSEIPKHLLEYWYISEDIADYFRTKGDVSSFYIFLHAFKTYNKTLGKEIELPTLDAMAKFGQFQILIGLALGKETEVTCNPINLFDFDSYSKLNITDV